MSVGAVVGNELDELRKMVPIPLLDTHSKQVDVLVQLVEESNGMYDHVVDMVHVEFETGASVKVSKTELCVDEVLVVETFN